MLHDYSSIDKIVHVIAKFLPDKREHRKKRAKIPGDIFVRLFRFTCIKVSGILTHKN